MRLDDTGLENASSDDGASDRGRNPRKSSFCG